jgi:hypothetical protein
MKCKMKQFTHDGPFPCRDRGNTGAYMRSEDAKKPADARRERSRITINPFFLMKGGENYVKHKRLYGKA